MNCEPLVSVMRHLVLRAGDVITDFFERDVIPVQEKSDSSPVTEADLEADALISDGLKQAFPSLKLVTEEQAVSQNRIGKTFLIVDPLDGTQEFIKRGKDFTINIAFVERGVPIYGVVYAPGHQRLFFTRSRTQAVEEVGPFSLDHIGRVKPISVRAADSDDFIAVESRRHRDDGTQTLIRKFGARRVKRVGSSLKFCLVATGEADIYPRFGPTMEWDTAAGHAILQSAGGEVVCLDTQEPLKYGKPEFRNPAFIAHSGGVQL
ncbi:MAG: 3'(2'),5'-bisphosphate nucleotidase CysQ [Aestuariivita sp.]|nr:3'(2'),5'-bisphosphate nucleotidase CysQ [Aestuariivita sp.]